MQQQSIIIVGGGIAGLIAAKKLCLQKQQVLLLEARNRLGGRINTIIPDRLPEIVLECGAEFIHGKLPATFELLHNYKIPFHKVEGEMVNLTKEKSSAHEGFAWNKMLQEMAGLKKDITLSDFLNDYFPGEKNISFNNSIKKFASGFDLADPDIASTKALYREWNAGSDDQFRIDGGYKKLIDALHDDCVKSGCEIFTSTIVKEIRWSKNSVSVLTTTGKLFSASKALITVPAGVLKDETKKGFIHFIPAIPEKINAFKEIGFGSVIKILLVFKTAFWQSEYKHAGFFFTPYSIPTWWTQEPKKNNLLIGWLGECETKKWSQKPGEEILQAAIDSLALSFDLHKNEIKEMLVHSKIINWNDEDFSNGGYSFSTLNTIVAKKQLAEPTENTIYFAGEALYDGLMQGTVEAALQSGIDAAEKMI
ncbi:MAG TPA: NAD(P)/FAD-dependent oxidoreductase [Puia sp.]|nr:NAD(P)/FAD-dependent oxidoreductase [Puia sp.]